MCWPTEEVRMSSGTRAACGLIVASLFAASTAAGQGARVQFGVGGSLTVPLGDFHADANGDGFKASSGGMEGYLLGGLGVYNVKLALTSGGVTADSSETKFSWNVGAGLSFAVGSADVFLESRYVDVAKSFEAAKTSFIPITAGV